MDSKELRHTTALRPDLEDEHRPNGLNWKTRTALRPLFSALAWGLTALFFDIPGLTEYFFFVESLHAPWRIEYILAPKPALAESLFTRIAQSNEDETNHVIARDRTCYALLNTYPYTGGHLMVVPYKQAQDFNDLTDEEMTDLMKLTRRCQNALTKVMKPEGFNIGLNLGKVAGAGILGHLHIHVVPRWFGDTNFMPVLGCTTVLPEALRDLAAKLRAALAQ